MTQFTRDQENAALLLQIREIKIEIGKRRYSSFDYSDLYSAGLDIMLRAIRSHKSDGKSSLDTWCKLKLRYGLVDWMRTKSGRRVRPDKRIQMVQLHNWNLVASKDSQPLEEKIYQDNQRRWMYEALGRIEKIPKWHRRAAIIRLYLDSENKNQAAISAGLSKTRIEQIIQCIARKIKSELAKAARA